MAAVLNLVVIELNRLTMMWSASTISLYMPCNTYH
jgi:hypothetical protein